MLIGYADDSTLIAVVPFPGVRVTVAESLNCDLVRVNAWCDIWGMKLNASMTKTMIEARAASQRFGILRKSWRVFHNWLLIGRCFCGFVLPVLEYCYAVWCSAADTHLKLLDRVVSDACFLAGGVLNCKLHTVLWSHIGILMRLPSADPRSTAGLLFSSQYLSGTIWLTPYSMVRDWRVSRAGPMPFCWPSCSLPFCLQLFSLSLRFLYMLVVWGWGLRTDRVSISLSRPCTVNLF